MLNSTRSVPAANARTSLATASGKAVAEVVLAMNESFASLNSRRPALSSPAGSDCPFHISPLVTIAGDPIVVSDQCPTTPTSPEETDTAGATCVVSEASSEPVHAINVAETRSATIGRRAAANGRCT